MQFRLGKIVIQPEDEEFITESPLATINYQSSFNSNKPMVEYFDDAKEHARKTIRLLNY